MFSPRNTIPRKGATRRHLNDASDEENGTHGCHHHWHQTSWARILPGPPVDPLSHLAKEARDARQTDETMEEISNTTRIKKDKARQGSNLSPNPAESKRAETGNRWEEPRHREDTPDKGWKGGAMRPLL
jgi:hypothetical protein